MTTAMRVGISGPEHLQGTIDVWLSALRLLPSDSRALAALMKSDTPMPTSIRYLIGELFHRGNPPLLDVEVVAKQTKAFAKAMEKLTASLEYYQRTSAGQPSQDAAEEIAERYGVTSRQIYAWLAEGMPKHFKSRLLKFTEENNFENFSDAPARIRRISSGKPMSRCRFR